MITSEKYGWSKSYANWDGYDYSTVIIAYYGLPSIFIYCMYIFICLHLVQDFVHQRYVYIKNVEEVGKLHIQNSKKKLNVTSIRLRLEKKIRGFFFRSFHEPLEWFARPMLWRRMVSSIHGYLDYDERSLGLRIAATRILGFSLGFL